MVDRLRFELQDSANSRQTHGDEFPDTTGVANSSMIPARSLLRTGLYRRSSRAAGIVSEVLARSWDFPQCIVPPIAKLLPEIHLTITRTW